MNKSSGNPMVRALDRITWKILGGMGRIFGALAAKDEEVYTYGIQSGDGQGFVSLAGTVGNTREAQVLITQEADFVADRFMYAAVDPTTGDFFPYQVATGPSFTVRIRDGGSDRTLTNFNLHVETIAGSIQRSTPFRKSRVFRRNSTVSFTFINLRATAMNIYFAMAGYKIYDEASLDLVRRR